MYLPFEQMPAHARVWVYQADRKFSPSEIDMVSQKLRAFCEQWNTHGKMMHTSFDIRFDQVVVLAVDESHLDASGCSIDSSVRTLREIEQALGLNLLDQGKVSVLQEDTLEVNPLSAVKGKVESGILKADSTVLNPMVKSKADLSDKWFIKANESWLRKYFAN